MTRRAVQPVAIDLASASDAELLAIARLRQAMDRERLPDDPPVPLGLIARRLRNRPPTMIPRDWVVRDGDDVVAMATLARWMNVSNERWRDCEILVRPDRRRQGIGTALLAAVAGACQDDIIVAGDTSSRTGGAPFARRVGAKAGIEARISEVRLADIDRALVAEWARIDPPGYRLVWIDDDIPDELMDNVIVAYETMNTAPKGDLSFGAEVFTPEMIRGWERVRHTNGGLQRLVLATSEATGATAGFTELGRHPETPWAVSQHGTAVVPAHRGHGIGKWIKARMIERVLSEWPDAEFVRTGNAYVNAPMLSINDRLGFRVTFSITAWEILVAELRRSLAGRVVS